MCYKFDSVKHVHSLDEKPLMGCSTVVGIINKPLGWWVAEQTLKPLGWQKYNKKVKGRYQIVPDKERLPDIETMLYGIREMKPKAFLDLLDSCYKNHNKKKDEAAERGTDLHAELERYIKAQMSDDDGLEFDPRITLFIEWSKKNVKKFLWSEVHSYSRELWTGGVADVGWINYEDKIVAGDFKSAKDIYFSYFLQVAGYDTMLSENGGYDAEGNKIFELPGPIEAYCVAPFGQEEFNPITLDYVDDFRAAFKSCVHLYKLNQLFDKVKNEINKANMIATDQSKTGTLAELLAAK